MHRFNPLGDPAAIRLSDTTRKLAGRYLAGEFNARLQPAAFSTADLDPTPCSHQRRLGQMTILTAQRAPLGILPEERLAGSVLLLDAVQHAIPGTGWSSISHTTVAFGDAVRKGLTGLESELRDSLAHAADADERDFTLSLLDAVTAMRIWTKRYAAAFRTEFAGAPYAAELAARLERVPELPPANFPDAVQSLWSFFEFERLNGNWSGLGRIDQILGPYLEHDLAAGAITLDEAREWIAHFWIKGTEWCFGARATTQFTPGSGDAQSYQNVILGGSDTDGRQVENAVTHLVLDVVEELHISDYPVAVRIGPAASERLLRRIAQVQLLGGGIVSVYNEEVVFAGLRRLGYPEEEIATFTNDGCWEVLIPGKTCFSYIPFDALELFQEALAATPDDADLETLFAAYSKRLYASCAEKVGHIRSTIARDADAALSLLIPDCRAARRGYHAGGPRYTVKALHPGGLPDVANSLSALQTWVSDRKLLTLAQVKELVRTDWADAETLRRRIFRETPCYGNNAPVADRWMARVVDDFAATMETLHGADGVLCPAGISTFGREITYAPHRQATAFGARAGEYLAPNLSPTPGTETGSVLDVLQSYCRLDLTRIPNGAPLDLRLDAAIRRHPEGEELQLALLRHFLHSTGFYLQIDTVDPELLKRAQRDPDRYPNLVVRISGWSARFASLDRTWQDMLIHRVALGA